MEETNIQKEIANLAESLRISRNKMNINIYGKKFVDLSNEYIKDHKKFFESMINTSVVFDNMSKDEKEKNISVLMSDITDFVSTAYLDGLYVGHQFKDDPYDLSDNIIDKNFMITFDFGDNDFGGYINESIKIWVDKWNATVLSIKRYRECNADNMVTYEYEKLKKLEDINNISNYLAKGCVASIINNNNDYITDNYNFEDVDTCISHAQEYVNYLDLLNISEYHKGSIKEITNFILTKYKDMQGKDEGYDLEHTWLNGEVLIIKVENGYASAWVQ